MEFPLDCHCHTEASACAEGATLQMYREQGPLPGFCFAVTDHSAHLYFPYERRWALWDEDVGEVLDQSRDDGPRRCREHFARQRAVQHGRMLVGVELDVLEDGRLVFDEALLPEMDLILGAIHCHKALKREQSDAVADAEYKLRIRALIAAGAHVIAHPFREHATAKRAVPAGLMVWLVEAAGEAGVALELNCHYPVRAEDLAMVRLCRDAGVKIAIGTDTHRPHEFGDFSYHRAILAEAGIDAVHSPQLFLGQDDVKLPRPSAVL